MPYQCGDSLDHVTQAVGLLPFRVRLRPRYLTALTGDLFAAGPCLSGGRTTSQAGETNAPNGSTDRSLDRS